jgi:hypothetical protein
MKMTICSLPVLASAVTETMQDLMEASKALLGLAAVATGLIMPLQAQDAFTNGLVAYYPFNGNANDVWGGQNGELIGNATPAADRFGQTGMACNFDGTAFVNVPDSTAIHLENMTISLWVQLDTTDGIVDILNKDDYLQGYQLYTLGSQVIFSIGDGDWHSTAGNGLIIANQWHHLTATYDSQTLRVYVDGTNTDSVSYVGTPAYSSNTLQIARNGALEAQYLSGNLGNLRLYGRALPPSEVRQLYSYEALLLPQIALLSSLKTVRPAFSKLVVGASYQLQVSGDLNTWTNQGSGFRATDSSMAFPQSFGVEQPQRLFFRLSQP